jgi:hypothetical protein
MSDIEIHAAEKRFGLTFPPDYRLLLATLHTPDPPMVGARWSGRGLLPSTESDHLLPAESRQFPDWTGDASPIDESIAWPLEGLVWSIEHDESWCPGWGARPRGRRQREALVRELAVVGPQLVPVYGHRYLVGPRERVGNPVLSIWGSDVIVYGSSLRSYLPLELGLERPPTGSVDSGGLGRIPFWQDVINGLPWYFA